VIEWRKTVAGGLATAVCVFGLTASADAASGARKKRLDPKSVVTGQDAPAYDGRRPGDHPKLDRKLNERADIGGTGRTRAIVVLKPGCSIDDDLLKTGGKKGQRLGVISGQVVELSNGQIRRLANNSCVLSIHWDRKVGGEMNRAAVTLGARAVQQSLGFDGAGVGVAIIDSGISGWHDDLTYHGSNNAVQVVGNQRVTKFVDFVNGRTTKYDDNGHGSHVAGIIAGNGWDTLGARAGIAPAANLVSLKVLDAQGNGYISNVIAALDWVVTNRVQYKIKVVNLSVGSAVTESYLTDPLTIAAKRVVDAGVVVVTAAGNFGRNRVDGRVQYGAITAPGNAPWVLTVGADSHQGTVTRADDVMTDYSSRGPTAQDFLAKPDVVAPGTGIVSLSVPGSLLATLHPTYLLGGTYALVGTSKPYLSLTGTSMASPMVAGTVALMYQANPKLTPNLAKAIIEYTAQDYHYSKLAQGAGFLNTEGAVRLARYLYTAQAGSTYPSSAAWSKQIIWGNRTIKQGVIKPAGSAYAVSTVWGSSSNADGENIVWGTRCPTTQCANILWGAAVVDDENIVWGTYDQNDDENIVWGTTAGDDENIVWGTACGEDCENIVWGTECGGRDCENIVWGTAEAGDGENIVWGTSADGENIVWGTAAEGDGENIVWGSSADDAPPIFDDPDSPESFDSVPFETLFDSVIPPVAEENLAPPTVLPINPDSNGGGL
jgi:serine protease AprX